MPVQLGFAPGKLILSGEYAMVFGEPGIAIPVDRGISASLSINPELNGIEYQWQEIANQKLWQAYVQEVIALCNERKAGLQGLLRIGNQLPLGKGMGSSTALVIACARCFFGQDCKEQALAIEDIVNPGHSGMDFSVIWEGKPIKFTRGQPVEVFNHDAAQLRNAYLIDTGQPDQPTPKLIGYIKEKQEDLRETFAKIRDCTERIAAGERLTSVIPDHHRAQVELGVVPEDVQLLIEQIERAGGCAKVVGAGGRTGGAGMVLALNVLTDILDDLPYPYVPIEEA